MPENIISVVNSTNTILGLLNQLSAQMNATIVPRLETTINTKRNVRPSDTPTGHPTLKYFGIGIRGFYNVDDGILSQPYIPSEEDMDLYEPVPFRIVPVEDELEVLNPEDPAFPYRMRTIETINSVQYVAYWLKLIEFPDDNIDITRVDLSTSEETVYTFDPSNLNPTPVQTNGVDTVDDVNSKIIISTDGRAIITGAELAEYIDIMKAGDYRYAKISEWGFYTGEERTVSAVDGNAVNFDYKESIYTQLATKRCGTGTDLSDPSTVVTEKIVYENGSTFLT